MWRETLMVCIMGFFWWNIAIAACKAENSVLDLNDDSSRKLLRQMSSEGNLKDNKLFAGAWIVVSSVALGMGLEKCHFPKPDDMSFMWKPAKDAMSEDEILTLNRVVTSNFRNSEQKGRLLLDRLLSQRRNLRPRHDAIRHQEQAIREFVFSSGEFSGSRFCRVASSAD